MSGTIMFPGQALGLVDFSELLTPGHDMALTVTPTAIT